MFTQFVARETLPMMIVGKKQQRPSSNEHMFCTNVRLISTGLDQKFNKQNNRPKISNTMRIGEENFELYKHGVLSILSSDEFLAVQNVLESRGIWDSDTFLVLKEWLLSEQRIVEAPITATNWAKLKKCWISVTLRKKGKLVNNSDQSYLFTTIFQAQRQMFQSKLLRSKIGSTSFNGIDSFPSSFFPIADLVFHRLASYCLEKKDFSSFLVLMDKMKECGIVPKKSTVRTLLGMMNNLPSFDQKSVRVLEELFIFCNLWHDSSEEEVGSLDEVIIFELLLTGNIPLLFCESSHSSHFFSVVIEINARIISSNFEALL